MGVLKYFHLPTQFPYFSKGFMDLKEVMLRPFKSCGIWATVNFNWSTLVRYLKGFN